MIPRVIHQIWLGSEVPDHLAAYMETWRHHHPDWEWRLWTDTNRPELRNEDLYRRADELAVAGHAHQLRADLLRYELLLDHGGMYADADFECLRPLDPILDVVDCATAWEIDGNPDRRTWFLNFAWAATVPGHPYLADIVEGCAANIAAHPTDRPNRQTGPHYLTRVWRQRHSESVVVFPSRMFYPYLYNQLGRADDDHLAAGAWAVHHWHNWRTNMAGRRR